MPTKNKKPVEYLEWIVVDLDGYDVLDGPTTMEKAEQFAKDHLKDHGDQEVVVAQVVTKFEAAIIPKPYRNIN